MGLIDKIRNYLNEEEPEELSDSVEEALDELIEEADRERADGVSEDTASEAGALAEESRGESDAEDATDAYMDSEKESEKASSDNKPRNGIFGDFIKKRKQKKLEKLRAALNVQPEKKPAMADIDPELISSMNSKGASGDERKAASDFCEQLIDISYHMEDMKREYQLVTNYLMDIQRIEELPVDMANDLVENARRIEMLNDSRSVYLQSEKLLTMEQYNTMATLEKEVPDTIVKLIDMEVRDSLLKNDMSYLEGEKEDLKFLHHEYVDGMSRLRGITVAVLVTFLIATSVLLAVAVAAKKSVTVYCLGIGLVAMFFFAISYARYLGLKSELSENDAKLKRAVSLLNKVKVKFINNTNTIDYIYEKYGVHSSNELEYQWEQYNTMVRDALRYSQANNDLRVYCDELIFKLKGIGLSDPFVWPKQTRALIDRREMVEIKHNLNVRRQKIREKLVTCDKIKTNAKVALRAAIDANPGLEAYIHDQLSSYNIRLSDA